MLTAIICICLLGALFGTGVFLTGALMGALLWMIKLPIVILLWVLGAVCCCTIILIPVGLILFKTGSVVLI